MRLRNSNQAVSKSPIRPVPPWADPKSFLFSAKKDLANWILTLERSPEGKAGGFPFSRALNNYTLLSSCFAILALELTGELQSIKEKKPKKIRSWVSFINSFQKDNGYFVDEAMLKSGYKTAKFSGKYISWQQTGYACHALNALGEKPIFPLKFIDPWLNRKFLQSWLEKISLKEIWFESNRLMWLMYFFYKTNHPELIDYVLDWLDSIQDPKTGYFGTAHGADLWTGMGGAYHLYMFYYWRGRPVRFLNKIIDSTLKLQLPEGSFLPLGGGACVDLDAIDILVNISRRTLYRHHDVMKALRRAQQSISNQRIPDGSFAESTGRGFKASDFFVMLYKAGFKMRNRLMMKKYLEKLVKVKFRRHRLIRYSSFFLAQYDIKKGDMWSSWFRLLALALINQTYPQLLGQRASWKFRSEPGPGWYSAQPIFSGESYYGERVEMNAPARVIENMKKRYGLLTGEIEKTDHLLDYGCGSGLGTRMLLPLSREVYAFDISRSAVVHVTKFGDLGDLKTTTSENDIPKNYFDKITCLEVIEHLPRSQHRELLTRLFSYMKPGGILYVSTPINYGMSSTYHSSNPFHLYEYSFPEIYRLLEQYGSIKYWNAGESFGFRVARGKGEPLSAWKLSVRMRTFFWQMATWRYREKKYKKMIEYLANYLYSYLPFSRL